jgi:hypothetical protein
MLTSAIVTSLLALTANSMLAFNTQHIACLQAANALRRRLAAMLIMPAICVWLRVIDQPTIKIC